MPNGFEVFSDKGVLQASDKHYDLSRSRFQDYNGRIEFSDRIYAIEPNANKGVNVGFIFDPPTLIQAVQGDGKLHVFEFGHVPQSSFGLEVYDDAGKLTFSSNLRSCNVIDFIDVPNYTNMGGTGNVLFSKNYTAQRIAIIPTRIPFFALSSPDFGYFHLGTLSFIRRGDRLEIERVVSEYNALSSFVGFEYPTRVSFAVIDVTNF